MAAKILKEIDETISHEGSMIHFKILLSRRNSISIVVYPGGVVKVRAPYRASLHYIMKTVEKRAGWIKTKQILMSKYDPIPAKKKFEEGEIYNYMGRQYSLKIIPDLVNRVDIEDGFLNVCVIRSDKDKIKNLIKKFYETAAKKIFLERLEVCKELVAEIGIKYNSTPKLRKMRSRWGSCSRSGEIILSYELIKAPLECIDYVIVHELCHIRQFNHSKKFYALLDAVMPDWKQRKEKLKMIRELDL